MFFLTLRILPMIIKISLRIAVRFLDDNIPSKMCFFILLLLFFTFFITYIKFFPTVNPSPGHCPSVLQTSHRSSTHVYGESEAKLSTAMLGSLLFPVLFIQE
jgi:hypothetical protein